MAVGVGNIDAHLLRYYLSVLRQRLNNGGVCIMNPTRANEVQGTGGRSIWRQFQFHPMIARHALILAFVKVSKKTGILLTNDLRHVLPLVIPRVRERLGLLCSHHL